MTPIEQEQYALVYYLQHANPGPILAKIAEDRIRWLEEKKQKTSQNEDFFGPKTLPFGKVK